MTDPDPRRDAADTDAWLDSLDPSALQFRDAGHLREIIAAADDVTAAEDRLRAVVTAARDAGDSWAAIGAALGVSRQAAFQRFAPRPDVVVAVVAEDDRGRWTVMKSTARRATVVVATRDEAVIRARALVRRSGGGEVVVHGADGTVVSTSRVSSPSRPTRRRAS